MKVATVFSLFLPLSDLSLAGPIQRSTALQVQSFYAEYTHESMGALHFVVHDTMQSDSCSLIWNTTSAVQPGLAPNKCLNQRFEFGFRYGIGNIEAFTLVVQHVNATQQGYETVSAYAKNSNWVCTENPVEGVVERYLPAVKLLGIDYS
ncbi:hypothetical protein N7462_004606 [Penicillium macrosclerotiorum]|uniref:uncharacterized protein n=1 Tax=Penicillium macrosclerotiorum TaxID=303699 RepID=UPI0025487A72|nr:uncharacterized protein N7462_004606 [Penicillium macrosclerotiorum]KAJ5690214.1 hypothetical protein N7462_004606 [Penicillium macrosclerotiorum]